MNAFCPIRQCLQLAQTNSKSLHRPTRAVRHQVDVTRFVNHPILPQQTRFLQRSALRRLAARYREVQIPESIARADLHAPRIGNRSQPSDSRFC